MGVIPGGSFGTGWGVLVGMLVFCFPGPASVSSWSPQVSCILPGGHLVQTAGLGADGSPGMADRPACSGSERRSAPSTAVAAGGGAPGSVQISSVQPEVAVRGGSGLDSSISSVAGTAAQGVAGVPSGVPGSSTPGQLELLLLGLQSRSDLVLLCNYVRERRMSSHKESKPPSKAAHVCDEKSTFFFMPKASTTRNYQQ
uniref:Uncharacterized protein LOC117365205 isoform X2 n=1 Tax=Geotrypetes seraphini TaxID=260995 RepID=A0A6P8S1E7_GEOSA|nr:uncharacterized protein LOC117365205 isoform X2 [Geotrypetes seraphini]